MISLQKLFILATLSQLITGGELGFYGGGSSIKEKSPKKEGKTQVLHDTPFKYRQNKPPLDLDPYSLDFDFLHKDQQSKEKSGGPYQSSSLKSDYQSPPVYNAPSSNYKRNGSPTLGSIYSTKSPTSYTSFSNPYKPNVKPSNEKPDLFSGNVGKSNSNFGDFGEEAKENHFDHFNDYEDYSYSPSAPSFEREEPNHHHHQQTGPSGFHHEEDNDGDFKDYAPKPFVHFAHNTPAPPRHGGYVNNFGQSDKAKEGPENAEPSYLRVEYGYATGGSQVKYSYHHGYKDNHQQ